MSILSMLKIVHCTKFEHWCSYANTATPTPQYTNVPKMIFRCGLGLNSWQPTDVPMVEHARFSPRCAFLLRITGGRTFARGIVAGDLERRAQRSPHDMEELRTALREFSDAIGILLLFTLPLYLFNFVYKLNLIYFILRKRHN